MHLVITSTICRCWGRWESQDNATFLTPNNNNSCLSVITASHSKPRLFYHLTLWYHCCMNATFDPRETTDNVCIINYLLLIRTDTTTGWAMGNGTSSFCNCGSRLSVYFLFHGHWRFPRRLKEMKTSHDKISKSLNGAKKKPIMVSELKHLR